MFNIIFYIFFIKNTVWSSNVNTVDDELLHRFIDEIDYERNIEEWMENRNHKSLFDLNLFQEIVRNAADILSVINTEKYADIKSLICKTNMYHGEMPYPYFKSWYIIDLINSILFNVSEQNLSNSDPDKINDFYENFLFAEYDNIKDELDWSVITLGRQLDRDGKMNAIILNLEEWALNDYERLNSDTAELFIKIINLIKSSNDKLESILPVDKNKPVYVKAHSEGFKKSRKNSRDGITRFYKDGSTKILTNKMLKSIKKCTKELTLQNKVDMEEYRNKTFVCNRSTANILICLFHYYSEIKGMCTMYEVQLIDYDEYQFKWSFYSLTPKERFKKNILKKEIPNLSSKIIFHKFGLIVDYDVQYSTIKSDDTIGEPIETRLILLSCGHQLGLELIDEFFDHFYNFETKTSTCHICRQTVEIIGSYDAIVYRCK